MKLIISQTPQEFGLISSQTGVITLYILWCMWNRGRIFEMDQWRVKMLKSFREIVSLLSSWKITWAAKPPVDFLGEVSHSCFIMFYCLRPNLDAFNPSWRFFQATLSTCKCGQGHAGRLELSLWPRGCGGMASGGTALKRGQISVSCCER